MIGRKLCSIQVVPYINSRICRWVLRMPLQLSKRLMELVLWGLHLKVCLVYLDDVLVLSQIFSENHNSLEEEFSRFCSAGLNWRLTNVILLAVKCPTWVMLYHVKVCSQMKRTWTRSGPDLLLGLSQSWEHLWVCAHTIGGLSGIVL